MPSPAPASDRYSFVQRRQRRWRVVAGIGGLFLAALALAGVARPAFYTRLFSGPWTSPAGLLTAGSTTEEGTPAPGVGSSTGAGTHAGQFAEPVAGTPADAARDVVVGDDGSSPGMSATDVAARKDAAVQCMDPSGVQLPASDRAGCRAAGPRAMMVSGASAPMGGFVAQGAGAGAGGAVSPALTVAAAGTKDVTATGSIKAASVGGVRVAAVAPAIASAHPRLILDAATLTALRQRAASNTAQWKALKATCDSYVGGSVSFPGGNAYPDKPNLGSGYQGEDYLPALLAEGMCYQVLKSTDATAAARYGDKAVDILVKMSAPTSQQGADPCTDSGYGIRFYGVGYGLGYDWVYDRLTSAQRTQVYTAANAWLTAWEAPGGCADFEYEHPQSNYYAGYFHAKAVIALGTFGENPSAQAQWNDWYGNQYGVRVQPYYAKHLAGGGWPEGFGNYAPLGIQNMSLPAREVKTATGTDLVHASAGYPYPVDSASYLLHFTWPSRDYIDDRDTNRSNGGSTPPGTAQAGMFQQVLGEITYWNSPLATAFRAYTAAVASATGSYSPAAPWLAFLEIDPGAGSTAFDTQPLSYLASGMGAVSARSDWGTSAVWMSFRAGPYVNNPAQGEQYFDQGSLALVRGRTPLLLNASGWLVHEPNGTADEDRIYADNYGSFNGSVFNGNRQLYNVFYVRNISGSNVATAYGQGARTTEDDGVRTRVTAYEDGTDYVYVRASHIEDMYRASGGALGQGVTGWSREITYLRPSTVIVHDRTAASSTSLDQFMAWHFPANPVAAGSASGSRRFDVTFNGAFAGAITTVIPANAATSIAALYPSSNPAKAWQLQVRPAAPATTQQWLTVFDLSSSPAKVAATSAVIINKGNVLGVRVAAADGVTVLINSAGAADTAVTSDIAYFVPAEAAHHLVTELKPFQGYSVTVNSQSSGRTINITSGGTVVASGKGVLGFYVNGSGAVQEAKPVYTTLPISTLPVSDPKPYKPGT